MLLKNKVASRKDMQRSVSIRPHPGSCQLFHNQSSRSPKISTEDGQVSKIVEIFWFGGELWHVCMHLHEFTVTTFCLTAIEPECLHAASRKRSAFWTRATDTHTT